MLSYLDSTQIPLYNSIQFLVATSYLELETRLMLANRGSGTLAHDRHVFYEIYQGRRMKRHGTVWARTSFPLLVLTTLSNKTLLITPKNLARPQTL
jgi:hypothetical protein